MRARNGKDRGQAAVLSLSAVAIAVALMAGAVHLGVRLVALERASTAADAAALAGLEGGREAAVMIAVRNGASLIGFTAIGDDVVATVRVGDAVGEARATRAP